MLRETRLFCRSIQEEDRSILDFLDADDTFVNERLARHYGIEGVRGRRLPTGLAGRDAEAWRADPGEHPRGHVEPNRTSPVKRGKWILENILGIAPRPPPSGVEALKEGEASGPARTLRERMERHRSDPACASCHGRMDPLGFALENFDAVGAWRTHENGQAIDASGRFPAGREFRGPEGLRRAAPRSPGRLRPLPRREDAHLRARPRPRSLRPPGTSTGSSPGWRATIIGSRPWSWPSSRAEPFREPSHGGGERHETIVDDLAQDRA